MVYISDNIKEEIDLRITILIILWKPVELVNESWSPINSTECYTITNFTLKVVDGEPDLTLDKSLGDCKFSDALYFNFMKLYYELL